MASKKIDEIFIGIGGSAAGLVSVVNTGIASLQGLMNKLFNLQNVIAGSALAAGVGWAVKLAADAEQAKVAFTVLLHSGEKAEAMLAGLKDYANVSPFSFKDVRSGAKLLLNYGVAGNDIIPIMKRLGDIAGGDANALEGLSRAFGQMSAAGKISGQDLNQMINAGFNPLKILSDSTGESILSLKTRMEKGALGVDELTKAIEIATSVGGDWYGMTEQQSKTTAGLFSSAMDVMDNAMTAFGQIVLETFGVNDLLQGFNDSAASIQANIEAWAPAAQVFHDIFIGTFKDVSVFIEEAFGSLGGFNEVLLMGIDSLVIFGKTAQFYFDNMQIAAGGIVTILAQIAMAWEYVSAKISGTQPDYSFSNALVEQRNKLFKQAGEGFNAIIDTALPSAEIKRRMDDAANAVKLNKELDFGSKKSQPAKSSPGEDALAKVLATLETKLAVFGKGEHAEERFKLAAQGVAEEQLIQLDNLHKQLDAMEERKKKEDEWKKKAEQIAKDVRNPFEKANDDFNEMKTLWQRGFLSVDAFTKGSQKLDSQFKFQAPKLVLSDSQEARQARLEQENGTKKGTYETKSLDAQERAASALETLVRTGGRYNGVQVDEESYSF